ncbi:MAG: MBL fold metallo-hydrolase [Desulfobacterales bacterium]|nr:MBL fold metallo-hydrolase [Desulfobacterales bacterium]
MHVTFYGAIREVTGSMHVLSTETDRILFDCGMYQGRRKEANEKNKKFPIEPKSITNMVLSHAHIDHSGRIPVLTKKNFPGRIFCTRATADASEYLLLDSAHIQESDAEYLNYKKVRHTLSQAGTTVNGKVISKRDLKDIKGLLKRNSYRLNSDKINEFIEEYDVDAVRPLYTQEDAEDALTQFDGYPYQHPVSIGKNMTCTFYDAGHILGSAISIVKVKENGREYKIGYTGDIGRFDKPILKNPTLNFAEEDRDLDFLIMESTYGNRLHEPTADLKNKLHDVVEETVARGGTIIIPSFAYGRTQELVYVMHELYNGSDIPKIPVYVDSPLATKLTKVFGEHPEVYDKETHETFLNHGLNPFSFKQINFVSSVEESMALMRDERPKVVISASGMCEAGRILHHLRCKIHNEKNTILIVGFMAQHTLGRRILEEGRAYEKAGRVGDAPIMKIMGKEYPLKAHVVKLGGFSAHADKNEMLHFLKDSNLNIKKIAIVHGEEDQSLSFAETLNTEGFDAFVPTEGETMEIN